MAPRHLTSAAKGFTLIELLTVIAIIGILAAIIIPTVGAVRKSAQAAACVSNLRQMGAAFQLYANTNRNNLPAPQDPDSSIVWPQNQWMYKLQPYLEARRGGNTTSNIALCYDGIFRCPGKINWDLAKADEYRISYGMNAYGTAEADKRKTRSLTSIRQPSIAMLAMDRDGFKEDGSVGLVGTYILNRTFVYRDAVALRHNRKDNVLFVDGHVESIAKDGLNYYLMKTQDSTVTPL